MTSNQTKLPTKPEPKQITERWDAWVADLPSEISIEQAQEEAAVVTEWIRRYDTAAMMARFVLGSVVYLCNPDWRNSRRYGESIVETIAERHHINANVLREARRCVEFFGLDLELFYEWVTENGDVKTWTQVRRLIRAWSDPEVLGPDALAERLAKRIESTGEDLQKLREQAHEGDIDEETYDGVRQNFVDDVESFAQEDTEDVFEEPKIETVRDEEYVNWCKTEKCYATGSPPPNEAHHVAQGGGAMKGSDRAVIPLDAEVHDYLEDKGHREAEEKYNFSIPQALFEANHKYEFGYIPSLPPDISFRRRGPKSPHQNGSVSEHA